MALYTSYKDRLQNILTESRSKRNHLTKGLSFDDKAIRKAERLNLIKAQRTFSNATPLSLQPLGEIAMGTIANAQLGLHPDFSHLKGTDDTEQHHIVSVFIDIQGSTNLFKKHDLVDVYMITNTIQSAAIQTCISLGGHIQRLQGDGTFIYFGGKQVDRNKAIRQALIACSMFTYFVENDIKDLFLTDGIEDICTRIGIDFGEDDDVMWANFGVLNVSELTTLSLHTSLASKMQQWAKRNGVVVGQNVKNLSQVQDDFFDYVRNSKGEIEKRYIFENPDENLHYTQYEFKWLKFLESLPFIRKDADGTLHLMSKDDQDRLARLRAGVTAATAGKAFATQTGAISTSPTEGVKHEPHRFHYGK